MGKKRRERGAVVKKLYLSDKDRKIAGVCGGVAEYLGIDPTVVRIIWWLSVFLGGLGVIAYLLGWLAIPRRPRGR